MASINGVNHSAKSNQFGCGFTILKYLDETDCSLTRDFGENYVKFNTEFTSSAFIERIFSLSGVTLSPPRNRFIDKKFERLAMLTLNDVQSYITVDITSSHRKKKHKKQLLNLFRPFNFVPLCSQRCWYRRYVLCHLLT